MSLQDGKCLYTTIREFVENSLDAAEAIGVLPDVSITMCVRTRIRSGQPRSASRTTHTHALTRRADSRAAVCAARRSEEISAASFANMVGLAPRGRTDEALYEDTAALAEQQARASADKTQRA